MGDYRLLKDTLLIYIKYMSCNTSWSLFSVFRLLDSSLFSFITHQPTNRLVDFQNTKPHINPQAINYSEKTGVFLT